ncbi:SWIB/MDM2 domain-containing protein [Aureococcus anophagefferens]|nr:SWIB/MDM2 domain-containing protein [Aureococcus anophagefferens]
MSDLVLRFHASDCGVVPETASGGVKVTPDDVGAPAEISQEGAELSKEISVCQYGACDASEVFPLACCQALVCASCVSKHADAAGPLFRCPFCSRADETFFECVSARGALVQRTGPRPYYANAAIRPVKLLCDASACACPRGREFDSRARTSTARVSLGGDDAWALRACDTCGQKARHERRFRREARDDEEDPRHPVLSDAMAAVVGVGRANHFRLVKLLWKYIKKHDLQNPANKNEIVCDAALKAAFKKDKVTSFGMSKLLSAHMHREHDSFLARAPVVDYAELERSDVDESDAEDVAGAVEDTPRTRRAFSELADYLAAKGLSRGVVTNWSVTTNQRGDAIFLDPAGRIFRSKAEVARFAKAAADAEDRAADDRRVEAARPPPAAEAAPPPPTLEGLFEGDAIEARCRGGAWYPGRVAFVHDGGGAIDVAYDDGDAEARASLALRRSPPRARRRDFEAELHDDDAEEQAVGRSLKQLARHLPLFVGSDDVAGARAGTVQFFDRVYATTHDGEPCPPARYAGWSVVLTRTASKPTRFVDGAGAVYKSRSEAAHAMGILAGQPSELAPVDQKWAETPTAIGALFEPGGVSSPVAPASPTPGGASPATAAAAPPPPLPAAAEVPPALEPEVKTSLAIAVARGVPVVTTAWLKECASRGFAEPRAEHASRDAAFERRHGLDLGVRAPARFEKRYAVAVEAGYALPDKPRYRAAAEAAGAVWIRKAGLEADRELLELGDATAPTPGLRMRPEDFLVAILRREDPADFVARAVRPVAREAEAGAPAPAAATPPKRKAARAPPKRSSKPDVVDLAASPAKKRKVDPEVLAPVLLRRGWTAVSTNGHSRWVDPTGATFGTLAAILRTELEAPDSLACARVLLEGGSHR